MARNAQDVAKAAAEMLRTFSKRLRELDARRKKIVADTIGAAEREKIAEIKKRYE